MADLAVLDALRAAARADPRNVPVRLHLAGLLLQSDGAAEGMELCAAVLAEQPDHLEALRLAERMAQALGLSDRAERYGRMARALAGEPLQQAPSKAPAPSAPEPSAGEKKVVQLRVVGADDKNTSPWEVEAQTVTLKDVAGLADVKRRIDLAFLKPLRNPELAKQYRKSLKGGLLLYGPPGCGKTFLAKAVAGELGARFMSIGLSDVLDMYLGESERKLHEIFETARRHAPCVVFFDEIDALGRKRSLQREGAGRNLVNQLLEEMDGVGAENQGLFVLAATNHPWDVDAALRRPGRFDRVLLVLPPDEPAREAMLRHQLQDKPLDARIDFKQLASKTKDFSGADLAHLCNSAVELAMEESLDAGAAQPVTFEHLKRCLAEVRPSTRPWFETAKNFVLFANEGGIYDDLQDYLRAKKLL